MIHKEKDKEKREMVQNAKEKKSNKLAVQSHLHSFPNLFN